MFFPFVLFLLYFFHLCCFFESKCPQGLKQNSYKRFFEKTFKKVWHLNVQPPFPDPLATRPSPPLLRTHPRQSPWAVH